VAVQCVGCSPRGAVWLCHCVCGGKKLVQAEDLRAGDTTSCGCSSYPALNKNSKWLGYGEISGSKWCSINKGASVRDLEVKITIEFAWELFLKQERKCAFTGVELQFSSSAQGVDCTASLDRIDSSRGYLPDNVQWVHKRLNWMKSNMSDQEFIEWCQLVAVHAERG
jgi:hypothetical protein